MIARDCRYLPRHAEQITWERVVPRRLLQKVSGGNVDEMKKTKAYQAVTPRGYSPNKVVGGVDLVGTYTFGNSRSVVLARRFQSVVLPAFEFLQCAAARMICRAVPRRAPLLSCGTDLAPAFSVATCPCTDTWDDCCTLTLRMHKTWDHMQRARQCSKMAVCTSGRVLFGRQAAPAHLGVKYLFPLTRFTVSTST